MYNIQTQNENITDNAGDRNLRVIGSFFCTGGQGWGFSGKSKQCRHEYGLGINLKNSRSVCGGVCVC